MKVGVKKLVVKKCPMCNESCTFIKIFISGTEISDKKSRSDRGEQMSRSDRGERMGELLDDDTFGASVATNNASSSVVEDSKMVSFDAWTYYLHF